MHTLALLQLADGRLPAGGHAHSAGLEHAVTDGRIRTFADVAAYLEGRLATAGLAEAAITVVARRVVDVRDWPTLDREAAARTAAPVLRTASRRLGRSLLRTGQATWPSLGLDALAAALPRGPMQPVALGAVGRAAGLGDRDVALVSIYGTLTTPANAAVRLLGLDPLAIHRLVASLGPAAEDLATTAVLEADRPIELTVAPSSILVDLAAEPHGRQEGRLFAS